jgi:hypothetical protein
MTYQDPDLRDRELRSSRVRDRDYGSNAMWGWIAGAVVLVLMLVFLFGGTTENTNTADMRSQPSANAPVVNTPPANNIANAPRGATVPPGTTQAPETSGQSSSPSPSPQQ